MQNLLLALLCAFLWSSQIVALPEGFEYASFSEEDFQDAESLDLVSSANRDLQDKESASSNFALSILDANPSSMVANCVNALSGAFSDAEIDLVIPGQQPLIVQRSYSSSDGKWNFRHMPTLRVGPSKGTRHLNAGYQDDMGSCIGYRSKLKYGTTLPQNQLLLSKEVFDHGLTNCCSEEISGQTNWRNSKVYFVRKDNEKMYLLHHGSNVQRIFSRCKRYGKKHHKGVAFGKFHIYKEVQPNGINVDYIYNKEDALYQVFQKNRSGTLLSTLEISQPSSQVTNWKSFSGDASYIFVDKNLTGCRTSEGLLVDYFYEKNRIKLKRLPEGRFTAIKYYHVGKNKGRVKELLAPVGIDDKPVHTHTFTYEKGTTTVADGVGVITKYESDEDNRLKSVIRLDENGKLYSKDTLYWEEKDATHAGNLLSRTFEDDGKTYFTKKLEYDSSDNVVKEQLWGNLSGAAKTANECEVYTKTFEYTQDKWHLPIKEDTGRIQTTLSYFPDSNLLKTRITSSSGKILKREFFEYDVNGVLITETWDDGEDFTERHLRITTPRTQLPIGLPEKIEEFYFDKGYHLLKKTVNHHNLQGRIVKQEHYGSDGQLAYALYWEYDLYGNVSKHIDAGNRITYFIYDANGNKTFEKGPRQDFYKQYYYDFSNRLIREDEIWDDGTKLFTHHGYNVLSQRVSTVDIYGNLTKSYYDAFGRIVKTELPIGETKNAYNAMGCIISAWDANGHCTKKQYNIRGQPTRIEHPNGTIEIKEYTLDGLLAKEVDSNGLQKIYTHDPFGRVVKTEYLDSQNNFLKETKASYSTFQKISETDESGVTTYYQYDGAGRKISEKTGHKQIVYAYDALGNLAKILESIDGTNFRITSKVYDLLGQIVEEKIEDTNGRIFKREKYAYDESGNRTVVETYLAENSSVRSITEFTPNGKPKKVTDALNNVTKFQYNYYPFFEITKTDALLSQEITTYNPQGNVSRIQRKNSDGKTIQCEEHQYDPAGNRISTKTTVFIADTPSRTTLVAWEYDSMHKMIRCIESDQKETTFTYNEIGKIQKIRKPNGTLLFHEYDLLGRLTRLYSSDHTVDYSYTYNLKDLPLTIQDNINHTLHSMSYDIYGNLLRETLGNSHTLSYTYDLLDRPLTVTLPDQSLIQYEYDALHLTSISRRKNNSLLYKHSYSAYDLAGNILEEQLIGNLGIRTWHYDNLQRVINLQTDKWRETIPEHGYDAIGNLLIRNVIDSQGPNQYTYAYDDLYQLTSEQEHTYQFDSLNNRIRKDSTHYTINALNQITDECNYDANGNLVQKGSQKLQYDALDRLVGVDQTQYQYDSLHRRLSKNINGQITEYLYQGSNEIGAIQNGKINQLRLLGIGPGADIGAAIALELDDQIYAPVHDPYGNIVALYNIEGQCAACYRYTAFGEAQQFGIDSPWKYASKRYDQETGFYYFGRRYYSPDIGRWITPDPAWFADGLNLYAYVHNNPFTYIDPDGQFALFLIPIAISLAADYCLPVATAYLAEYTGAIAVTSFLTGVVQGYNGDMLPESTGDAGMSLLLNAGKIAGTAISLANAPKTASNIGTQIISNTFGQAALTKLGNAGSRACSWFSSALARKNTAQTTQKSPPSQKNSL